MADGAARAHLCRVPGLVPTVPVTSGTQSTGAPPAILFTPALLADTPSTARYNSRFHPRETAP